MFGRDITYYFRASRFGAVFPMLMACAGARPDEDQALNSQQRSLVQATCTDVMRLEEGEAQWAGCVSGLSTSLADEIKGRDITNAGQPCLQDGLKRGTAEFSLCIRDRQNVHGVSLTQNNETAERAPGAPVILANSAGIPKEASESYFGTPYEERHRKELYSCAQLSLDPSSRQFAQRVADLDSTLLAIDHPNN